MSSQGLLLPDSRIYTRGHEHRKRRGVGEAPGCTAGLGQEEGLWTSQARCGVCAVCISPCLAGRRGRVKGWGWALPSAHESPDSTSLMHPRVPCPFYWETGWVGEVYGTDLFMALCYKDRGQRPRPGTNLHDGLPQFNHLYSAETNFTPPHFTGQQEDAK
jgi:hypothetical protein